MKHHYGTPISINRTELISTKPLRTVFLLEGRKDDREVRFALHVRQRPYPNTQSEERHAIKTALSNGVLTVELIHFDESQTNPFGAPFLLETYIKGNPFLDCKNLFKQAPEKLFDNMVKLHRIKCDQKNASVPDSEFLSKYKAECLSKLTGSSLIDVRLLNRMFDDVLQWQKKMDFSSHTSLLHGDLHYSNMIITANDSFYFIDWEMASVGDYCKDLVYFKARTLDYLFPEENRSLFNSLIRYYKEAFNEDDLEIRMRYYLSYQYLQIIWQCCFPILTEQWLSFYFKKYCEFTQL
ncbi:MAG: phosphotransferase family protein [Candidatus Omnitrophota bacterium]